MKKTKKKIEAIELLANGKSIAETAATMQCQPSDISEMLKDPAFVEAVDSRVAELAHEARWALMKFKDAALNMINKSMTGHSLSTSQEKIVNSVLKSIGVIVTEPQQTLPSGEFKVKLGSKRRENLPTKKDPAPPGIADE